MAGQSWLLFACVDKVKEKIQHTLLWHFINSVCIYAVEQDIPGGLNSLKMDTILQKYPMKCPRMMCVNAGFYVTNLHYKCLNL